MNAGTETAAALAERVRSVVVEKHAGDFALPLTDAVPVEEPLEIRLGFDRDELRVVRSVAVTMRTPGHDAELAAGFLASEGILRAPQEIGSVSLPAANVVQIDLCPGLSPDLRALERNFYTTSSCGVCGKASLAAVRAVLAKPLPTGQPRLSARLVPELPDRLRTAQRVFDQTGGLHAAGLFDPAGRLLAAHEDVGRHNAVDKLLGECFLGGGWPAHETVLVVSGRASFELMQKALMAGIPILAAVGAPSSLAVSLAVESGATLLGFVRPERFNIYAGAERISP